MESSNERCHTPSSLEQTPKEANLCSREQSFSGTTEQVQDKLAEGRKFIGSLPLDVETDLSEATKYFHSSEATGISALAALAASPSTKSASLSLTSTPVRAMKEMTLQETTGGNFGFSRPKRLPRKLFADELELGPESVPKPHQNLTFSFYSNKQVNDETDDDTSSSSRNSSKQEYLEMQPEGNSKLHSLNRRSTDSSLSLNVREMKEVITSPVRSEKGSNVKFATREKERKSCKCKNSMCLKLYCECFAAGQLCSNCSCQNCLNDEDHGKEVSEARNAILLRNPAAFEPKMTAVPKEDGALAIKHQKGCNCKRSGCQKNYCECFHAGVFCSNICKCNDCGNREDDNSEKSTNLSHILSDSGIGIRGALSPLRGETNGYQHLLFMESPRKRWRESSSSSYSDQSSFRKSRSLTHFDSAFYEQKKKLMEEESFEKSEATSESLDIPVSSLAANSSQDPLACDERSIMDKKNTPVIHSLHSDVTGRSRLRIPLFSHLLDTKKSSVPVAFQKSNLSEGRNTTNSSNH
ncbi:Protein lin-54 [Galdieria sulphuraria]|nr:Protein lin-54 [Galdieria sulphuraria]